MRGGRCCLEACPTASEKILAGVSGLTGAEGLVDKGLEVHLPVVYLPQASTVGLG